MRFNDFESGARGKTGAPSRNRVRLRLCWLYGLAYRARVKERTGVFEFSDALYWTLKEGAYEAFKWKHGPEAPDNYLTDHYVNYPFVLVRMNRIEPQALKDLLGNPANLNPQPHAGLQFLS